ncbi:MAG: flagellar filament capping protein FliD [Veillonellales bacterium]
MSTSSSVTVTTVNGTTRATGLSSGLDVDSIVSSLMTAERAKKLNKLEQKEQLAEWKQTDYRTLIADIQTFSSKYFDTTSSSSLLKTSNFLKYTATSSDSAVTVTAASTASAGTNTVAVTQLATKAARTSNGSVSKDVQGSTTPTYSSLSGESFVITLDGTAKTVTLDSSVTDLSSLQTAIDDAVGSGKVTVSADSSTGYLSITAADSGVNKITISAPTSSSSTSALSNLGFGTDAVLSNRLDTSDELSTIADQLSSSTALTFNTDGQIDLTINGTTLTFDKTDTLADMMSTVNKSDAGVTMTYDSITGELEMTADSTGAGDTLDVTEGTGSNFMSVLLSESTAGKDAKITLDNQSLTRSSNTITVDGVTYTANETTTTASAQATLADAITTATSGTTTTKKAAVTTAYANYTAALAAGGTSTTTAATIVSTKTALDSAISALGDSTLSSALTTYNTAAGTAINTAAAAEAAGDSTANETAVTSAISAAAATSSTADTVTVTQDTDGVYDLIKDFVDDYNTLISTINTELDENYDSDYAPLTDDQESSMTDTEITAWEKKAKVGLLESDSTLTDFISDVRAALIDSVSGQSTTIFSIGISTGSYDTKGQLSIDEDTLKAAIASDPEEVMDLFTQQATSTTASGTSLAGTTIVRSLSSSDLTTRYKEEGIAYRFYDTIQKYISSLSDSSGSKGSLLELAGISDDSSDTDNTLTTQIDEYTSEISTEKTRLNTVEDNLYTKYSTLETYISEMNTQLSALSSMTSS